MTFKEIFSDEKLSASEKVKAIAELITSIRKEYGNADAEITAPKVPTTDGMLDISLLTDEDKVALAEREVRSTVIFCSEANEAVEGSVFDRTFEANIATNPILANLTATSGSKYI